MAVSANRLEILQIADAVAREKLIEREIVIAAMEDSYAKAARSRYGTETEVHAEINPRTGELRLSRYLHVVERVENPAIEIALPDAQREAFLLQQEGGLATQMIVDGRRGDVRGVHLQQHHVAGRDEARRAACVARCGGAMELEPGPPHELEQGVDAGMVVLESVGAPDEKVGKAVETCPDEFYGAYWSEFAPLKERWENDQPTGVFFLDPKKDGWKRMPRAPRYQSSSSLLQPMLPSRPASMDRCTCS